MRIAFVCDYALNYTGGAQSVFFDEIELLRASGYEVLVVAPRPPRGEMSAKIGDTAGLTESTWQIPGADLPVLRNSRTRRRHLERLFRDRRIDVVHVHSEFGLTSAAVAAAARLGIPVVHTVHAFFWQGPDLRGLDRVAGAAIRSTVRALRGSPSWNRVHAPRAVDAALRSATLTAAQAADAVISPSAHQAEALRAAGLTHATVVPNPMRTRTACPAPLTRIDGPLRVVWVGRLAREKRPLEFLHAVARAGKLLGPHSLDVTVIGDGPLLAEARQIADRMSPGGGSRIRFTGSVDRSEVDRRMRDSHLVALTSFGADNQPVVVVEAFHAARSVLYVDPRLEEGLADAGILCGSPEIEGMAAMLVHLVRHPEVVVARSAQTVAASERFSPERHVQALHTIYATTRSRAGAGRR